MISQVWFKMPFRWWQNVWPTVFAILLSASLHAQSLSAMPAPAPQTADRTEEFREHEIAHQGDWWHVRIKYPSMDGADDFNEIVRRDVDSTAASFQKSLPHKASAGYPDYGAYLEGTFTAHVLKNGIVSVLFDYSEYTPGAVHPWGILSSINYDLHAHRRLKLSDLFRPGTNYLSRLSTLSIQSLDQREYADTEAIRHGAAPLEKNFAVFTLSDTDLIVHFQQYQVAPGVVPADQVEIPLRNLAPLLRKEFVPAH